MANHTMSSNNHPSATANKARSCLILKGGGEVTKPTEHDIILKNYEEAHPTIVKLFLIKNGNKFEKIPISMYFKFSSKVVKAIIAISMQFFVKLSLSDYVRFLFLLNNNKVWSLILH